MIVADVDESKQMDYDINFQLLRLIDCDIRFVTNKNSFLSKFPFLSVCIKYSKRVFLSFTTKTDLIRMLHTRFVLERDCMQPPTNDALFISTFFVKA